MKTIILPSKKKVAETVADLIQEKIKKKPNLVLGLATGGTMMPLYKELRKRKIDWSKVKTFNLDEYVGIKKKKDSYHYFMDKYLFSKINIKRKNTHFPKNKDYDSEIRKAGGIDLQILGIGVNDHIGFNEPRSSFTSKTRVVNLSDETRRSNSRFFQSLNSVPKKAITMGISTILKAKEIYLIATGRKKALAIQKAVECKPNEKIPATALKKHKRVSFFLDKKASGKLGD